MGESSSQRIRTGAEETGREGGRAGARSAQGSSVAPAAQELLRLQSAAGNVAVARAVKHRARAAMRPPDGGGGRGHSGAAPGGPTAAPPAGAAETAIVASTKDP